MAESLSSPFTGDNLFRETLSFLSSDPLFLTFFTFYAVILLYFPSLFLSFALSPVLISTALLLLSLLRFGVAQNPAPQETAGDCLETRPQDFDEVARTRKHEFVSNPYFADSFVEWDVWAPLEVIYEEYEGQEAEENEAVSQENRDEHQMNAIQRYASLSLFYPESDTDNSSEGDSTAFLGSDSPEELCFQWEDEDYRDGLIEIALGEKRMSEVDEDNLIEIDLSDGEIKCISHRFSGK